MTQKTLNEIYENMFPDGSCSLYSKFLLWKKEALPNYPSLDKLHDLSRVFSDEFDNVVVLTRQLREVSNQNNEEMLFIRVIIAMEFVLSIAREAGIEVPNFPPPIEGLEGLYDTMKVMDA